jgi:hypothetical protein
MNYEHLCDLLILLGLACILTLLKFMHAFKKFAHMRYVFVCNLVVDIKVYQGDLYNMYLEQTFNFTMDTFWAFKSLFECKHKLWSSTVGLWSKWPTYMGGAPWFRDHDAYICHYMCICCCWITSEKPMGR